MGGRCARYGASVRICARQRRRRPLSVLVTFRAPVSSSELVWAQWRGAEYTTFSPPPPGTTVELPAADFAQLLFGGQAAPLERGAAKTNSATFPAPSPLTDREPRRSIGWRSEASASVPAMGRCLDLGCAALGRPLAGHHFGTPACEARARAPGARGATAVGAPSLERRAAALLVRTSLGVAARVLDRAGLPLRLGAGVSPQNERLGQGPACPGRDGLRRGTPLMPDSWISCSFREVHETTP
jgi:hypothetical protein